MHYIQLSLFYSCVALICGLCMPLTHNSCAPLIYCLFALLANHSYVTSIHYLCITFMYCNHFLFMYYTHLWIIRYTFCLIMQCTHSLFMFLPFSLESLSSFFLLARVLSHDQDKHAKR